MPTALLTKGVEILLKTAKLAITFSYFRSIDHVSGMDLTGLSVALVRTADGAVLASPSELDSGGSIMKEKYVDTSVAAQAFDEQKGRAGARSGSSRTFVSSTNR